MRQRSGLAAAALAFLLALSCTPALAGGASSPDDAATPAALESSSKTGGQDAEADSRQPGASPADAATAGAAPSAPQAASSPLATSSPLSHTTPSPAATPGRTSQADAAAGSRPQARSSAAWTVSFDPAGGSSIGSQTIPDGEQASRPSPDPSRDDYLFDGWFQDNVAYDFSQPVTGSTTLTARWTSKDTQHWTISPSQGPTAGGTNTTLTPPAQRGIRFSQISSGNGHTLAIGSDGSLYTWGDNSNGRLGRDTGGKTISGTPADDRPGKVDKPAGAPEGFTWTAAAAGDLHSMALGSDGNLYTWGNNEKGALGRDTSKTPASHPGKIDKPDGFTWKCVTGGGWFSMAIGSDGNLYTWGSNDNGQLGRDTSKTPASQPGKVDKPAGAPDGFTWTTAAAGGWFSMAIGSDGSLYTWGDNDHGELGRSTSITPYDRPGLVDKPADAPTGFTWKQIEAGYFYSLAFDSDMNLYTWGDNGNGQLGDGTATDRNRPALVDKPADAPDRFVFTQACTKNDHVMSLGSDGSLYTWGNNNSGQLGRDTSMTPASRPGKVGKPAGPPKGFAWSAIIVGGWRSMAIGSDGNLYTWGENNLGQLGRDITDATPQSRPGMVVFPVAPTVTEVLFGQARTTGITANPDGTWQATTPKHDPGPVDVTVVWNRNGPQPDAHLQYTFISPKYQVDFISTNGSCPAPTGMPPAQSVTEGGQAERPYPDPKAEGCLFDGWFQGDVAYDFTQPVTGKVTLTARWTKGDGRWTISPTQGPESGGTEVTLTPPAQRGIRFSQISLNGYHSAAIGSDGNLYTWGNNQYGQLGDGTDSDRTKPVLIDKPTGAPEGFTWKQVILGSYHSAAVGSDGNLYTWGWNDEGQLGRDTNITPANQPGLVDKPQGAPEGFDWKQVRLGGMHSAAIGSDGNLYTWGYNGYGQLGDGTNTSRNKPIPVDKPKGAPEGFTWKQISLATHDSAAIGSDGNLYIWGDDGYGQLGDGTDANRYMPGPVDKPQGAPDGFTWKQASLGGIHSAAIGSDGSLYTWGANNHGELGDGTNTDRYRPVQVGKPTGAPDGFTWKHIRIGGVHSSAFGSDGNLYTWGWNDDGQLGRDTNIIPANQPGLVDKPQGAPDGFTWIRVSLGKYHSAAIGSDGSLYTWGSNEYGQLGVPGASSWRAGLVLLRQSPGVPTGVCFDQNRGQGLCSLAGEGLAPNPDGTWKVTTPASTPGLVPVAIDWTQDGEQQETDTSNAYRYLSIAGLPLTGGDGMLLLLATGLLAAGAATAAKSQRRQACTAA